MNTFEALKKTATKSKEFGHKSYANALVGNVSGAIVAMDDISPLEHKMSVKLRSKNLIPYPYAETTKTTNGITFTDNGDGTITVNGTATEDARFNMSYNKRPWILALEANTYYTLSGCPSGGSSETYYLCYSADPDGTMDDYGWTKTQKFDFPVTNYQILIVIKSGTVCDNLVFKPQLELGTVATAHESYVAEDTQVTVRSCGKNLLSMVNGTYQLSTYYTATLNDGFIRIDRKASDAPAECSSMVLRQYMDFFLPAGTYCLPVRYSEKVNMQVFLLYIEIDGSSISNQYYFTLDKTSHIRIGFYLYDDANYTVDGYVTANMMLTRSDIAQPFEPIVEGETITTTIAEGVEFTSISPNMTITTDTSGAIIDTEYNKDLNTAFDTAYELVYSGTPIIEEGPEGFYWSVYSKDIYYEDGTYESKRLPAGLLMFLFRGINNDVCVYVNNLLNEDPNNPLRGLHSDIMSSVFLMPGCYENGGINTPSVIHCDGNYAYLYPAFESAVDAFSGLSVMPVEIYKVKGFNMNILASY